MRFAIWTAVSTKKQAEDDKVSLAVQEEKCRETARRKGWVETAGPFIVPGESRTRWINLRDAEEQIPQLKEMLNQAQRGDYDVLVLYDYTRLRELLDPVSRALSAYSVQIYSINQPTEPVTPEEFGSSFADTSSNIFIAGFTSRTEISNIRRRYRIGMPTRISRGLPKGNPPYGYRKPPGHEYNSKAVPIIDPIKSIVVLKIKDLFLSGLSMPQIADALNDEGIPTPTGNPKWPPNCVRVILRNRFYCGEVFFGKHRRSVDPRTGRYTRVANSPNRVVVANGLHQPLWNKETQQQIEDEFARRGGKKYTGRRTHRLSNLLYCGVCGSRCWIACPGGYDKYRNWSCSSDRTHVIMKDTILVPMVARELVAALQDISAIQLPAQEDRSAMLSASLADMRTRRSRITDAYEAGALPLSEYGTRVSTIDKRINEIETELLDADQIANKRKNQLEAMRDLSVVIESIPDYILNAPEQEVNTQLRKVLEKIIIEKGKVSLSFRL